MLHLLQPLMPRPCVVGRTEKRRRRGGRPSAWAKRQKAKVYWICPTIEESETADFAAVEERHRALAPLAPGRVGLVHGRMKPHDKDNAMTAFAGDEAVQYLRAG
jgi:RecG-like helicase